MSTTTSTVHAAATFGDARELAAVTLRILAEQTVGSYTGDPAADFGRYIDAGMLFGWTEARLRFAGADELVSDGVPEELAGPLLRTALFLAADAAREIRWIDEEERDGSLLEHDDGRPRRRPELELAERVLGALGGR